MLRYGLRLVTVIIALSMTGVPAWTETAPKEKKKYPHPHTLHSEVMSEKSADLSIDEIKDWPVFLKNLQGNLNNLPLGDEARIVIRGFKPENLGNDEKTLVIGELNKLLADERLVSQARKVASLSAETKRAESDYRNTKTREDLRLLNRSILNDVFPQIERKQKIRELGKITCTTCHEAYAPVEKELKEAGVDEKSVMDCFSSAIKGEGMIEECVEKANVLKRSKIEDYGPLRNFIVRADTKGEIPFFVAAHPENPYTFKPLLKRLVCVECHGQDRKVTKVRGSDGKIKDVPVFYGLGSDKPRTGTRPDKNEN